MLVGALVGAAIVLTSQLQRCSGTSWHQAPACGGCGAAAPAAQRPYYAIALATGLKPIELNVFVQSWRRFSPQTTL